MTSRHSIPIWLGFCASTLVGLTICAIVSYSRQVSVSAHTSAHQFFQIEFHVGRVALSCVRNPASTPLPPSPQVFGLDVSPIDSGGFAGAGRWPFSVQALTDRWGRFRCYLVFPLWLPACAIATVGWRAIVRSKSVTALNCCKICGYDLRAYPNNPAQR